MRRVLIVAYYYPPIAGIGSIRAASFTRFLPEFGWEPTVLTPADTPHPADPSLDVGRVPVVRTRSLEFSRPNAQPSGSPEANATAVPGQPPARSKPSRWLRDLVRHLVFPDPQIGWYPGATAGGLRTLREGHFDVIFSSAFPITSHFVARTLKRRSSVPWVAEFRDPWSDDPEFRLMSPIARRLERSMVAEADAVIMPTPTWAAHYATRWGRTVEVLPNGFDPVPATDGAIRPGILTHLGTYDPAKQDLTGLWEAVRRLRGTSSPVSQIQFVGQLSPAARADLAASGLDDLITQTGLLAQEDALRTVAASTVLFLAGSSDDDPIARGWVPAKLFEYLATDRPIIYLGDPASDPAALLDGQPGCGVVEPSDVDGIADALRGLLRPASYRRQLDHLSRRSRVGELARILDAAAESS